MPREDVAIVGMAAVFPGAPDLDTYWHNIEGGVDAIADVPPSRWDPVYYDPSATAVDRFYCRRGGFVEPTFDPVAFGIMPVAVSGAEPDQLLALQVASRALDDAGCTVPRERTGVIIGRGGYLTPAMARLADRVRTAQQVVTTIAELVPDVDPATLDKIRAALQSKAGELGPEAAIGLVPNLAASRIANRLDLRGPAYTVDAACASSLIAVDHACRELADRRCDLVIAGGVHVCHDVTFWSVFTQLGALSRAQTIRPFDRRADGILIGEGAGLVVLERLADAERAGHRIYAVIRGTGVSSDGRESSPMRPRLDGQMTALDRAWTGLPRELGLVEAHGTGTPTGDEVELTALGEFFGGTTGERAALGSVKSMIGHAMPAAGAAGLIKAALAIHHGVLPPSLHCEEPHDALAKTRFRVLGKAEPWGELPRRAGVSAFGFGGINAHVVIDAHAASRPKARASAPATELLALAADSIDGLRAALEHGGGTGRMRLAMLDPTPERRAMANKVVDRGKPWRGNHDIWFAPEPIGGKLAFVFPGVEAAFAPDLGDVPRRLGVPAPSAIDTAIAADETDIERRGSGVFALGRYLAAVLGKLRVRPDVMIGHSLGEWTGMVASEMIPPGAIDAFLAALPPGIDVPDVVFAAVGCGAAGAEAALEGLDHIAVSHDNCPHQSIVCGKRDRVQLAVERLGARGVLCQELPFRSGFHSPLFEDFVAPHRGRIADLALQKPAVPLWSATIAAPYPDDPAGIRTLAMRHLVEPVRFRELVEHLYGEGVRTFVQLGVGSVLGFVGDTLRGKDHLAVAAVSHQHSGGSQLARVRGALWTAGFEIALAETKAPAPRSQVKLDLGAPLVKLGGAVPTISAAPALPDPKGDPILAEAVAALREISDATYAIVDAYRRRTAPTRPRERIITRTMSVDAEPSLLDHCFYRQPADWPTVSDRFPVVPMTMMIAMMIDAARAHAPELVAIELTDIMALRWLAVAPAVQIEIRSVLDGDRVEVEIVGYAHATVRLAPAFPAAPEPALAPLANPRATPVTAAELYVGRWMFHGPRYAGVVAMGPLGDDGIDGVIETLPAPGALLDNAGQLMGWWVMNHETHDRLAMPLRIARIAFFGHDPAAPARVDCRVRIRDLKERDVRADLELVAGGRLWCKIDSWEDRRFDSDDVVWEVLRYPEDNALARQRGPWVDVTEHWRGASSRELMMRRYLCEAERERYEQVGMRRRRGWLLGRMAIKDAVRLHAWQHGASKIFPVEVEVGNEASGRPFVRGSALRVSVAHKDDRAVAIVSLDHEVGIDLEKIETRSDAFANVSFTQAELALGAGRPRDEWMARLWTAKEAVGKARGTGVTDPKKLEVRAASGDRLQIDDAVVDTLRDGDYMIAWTMLPRTAS